MDTGLDRSDFETLLGVVAELGAVRPLASLRSDTVAILPSLVEADHPAWNEVDPATGRIDAALPAAFERAYADRLPKIFAAFAEHVDEHPVIREYRRNGNGQPKAISDFVSAEAFHATALYRTVYEVLGTEDQLSFMLPAPDVTIGITLNRPERGFSTRDRNVLNLLRPHLVQAYRNALALEAATAALNAVDTLAEDNGEGFVVVDRTGKIVHMTPTASKLLQRFFPGQSQASLPEDLAEYAAHPTSPSGPRWPMVHKDLVVRHLHGGGTTLLALARAGSRPTPHALRQLGLTAREAEVLLCISEGIPTKGTAARLHISPRTVDKHVERSLKKLGVDSRLAAANLINQITS